MRLFVAIAPSPEAADHLASALPPLGGLRPTPQEHWHITLVFCGELEASTADSLLAALPRVAERAEPVELALRGAGTFGDVLWVGVHGSLSGLQAEVAHAVAGSGVRLEERTFHAHLTLGRGRQAASWARRIASYSGPAWPATELRLVRSRLGAPVRHETLHAWPLGAG